MTEFQLDGVDYLRPAEVAARLGITTQAVYRLTQRGSLSHIRPWPRFLLIPASEVQARQQRRVSS